MRQMLRARAARAAAACRRGASSAAGIQVATFPMVVPQFEALDTPCQLALGEPAIVAVESQPFPSTEPLATGQPDALLADLVEEAARSQQETKVESLLDALLPKRKKSKEADEKPNAGDTALTVKGIHSQCQRTEAHAHEILRQVLGSKKGPLVRDVREVELELGDVSHSRPRAPRFNRPRYHGPRADSRPE